MDRETLTRSLHTTSSRCAWVGLRKSSWVVLLEANLTAAAATRRSLLKALFTEALAPPKIAN
jgi:hypothetical protein